MFETVFGPHLPNLRLASGRVFIRPPEVADWPSWAELRTVSRAFLTPWEPTWPADALSRAAYRRRLARYSADWREDEGYNFLVFRAADKRLLGGLGLSNVRRGVAETGSLGYWIGAPHARQGYMTEALGLVLAFAFEQLRLHRVEAACLPINDASRSLLLTLGFTQEGYARRFLCIDGAWRDHLLFALLQEDWMRQTQGEAAAG